ncbi:MAG: phytoene synthase [Cyanobacteria bacterium J06641_5]
MLQLTEPRSINPQASSIDDAYELCRQITAKYSKTFYMGTMLMPAAKRQAIWAIYVWCRRTDELVDGPQAAYTTHETLERWEQRLEALFAGHPGDDYDLALVNAIERFPRLEIQPFRDMIAGQHMDLDRSRYATFEDLCLYCYRVAGTVGIMSNAILGCAPSNAPAPWEQGNREPYVPKDEAVALGIANQLTNILRDVGEDARRGRIYLPLEDLRRFDYSEEDLLAGKIDARWRALMDFQIQRARAYYLQAEAGIRSLSPDARWTVWTALMLYQGILDAIVTRNQYDVFTRRAFVPKWEKFFYLPVSWLRAQSL